MRALVAIALAGAQLLAPGPVIANQGNVSLRLAGKEVALPGGVSARLATLARETFARCGPNTRQHPHNFGPSATLASVRRDRTLDGSRLHIAYDAPFATVSHLGGELRVTEVTLGLEREGLFVGPAFSRDGLGTVEHLLCEYLPALEIACLPELAPYLPARYAQTCARFERGADGRILMPPPDIAPSCS
jgi:hypothetical protein